jgi:hypothetical protein
MMNTHEKRFGKRKIEEESLQIENTARGGQCHLAVPPMYGRLVTDPCGSVPRLFPRSWTLKVSGDQNKIGGQTNSKGKRNNSQTNAKFNGI